MASIVLLSTGDSGTPYSTSVSAEEDSGPIKQYLDRKKKWPEWDPPQREANVVKEKKKKKGKKLDSSDLSLT